MAQTAYQLLMMAPDDEITRCRLIYIASEQGDWHEAKHYLINMVRDWEGLDFQKEAQELLNIISEY